MRYKIGWLTTCTNDPPSDEVTEKLYSLGFENEGETLFKTNEQLFQALKDDKVQIGVGNLSAFPVFSETDEIVVAAISERNNYGYGLLKSSKKTAYINIQNLEKENKILVSNRLAYEQIIQFIDQDYVELSNFKEDEVWKLIEKDENLLILVDRNFTFNHKIAASQAMMFPIHPTELTGKAGLNIIAYLTHKDALENRKLLRKITEPQWIRISNIERAIHKFMGPEMSEKLGVYCWTDQKGNYRTTAVALDPYRRINVSQSTHAGMAEKVVHLLNSY